MARQNRRSIPICAALACVAVTAPAPEARATFPGGNGPIAFVSNRDAGADEIYVMASDGTGQTRLTHSPLGASASLPDFSPDRLKIAYTSDADGNGAEIWVMDSDGTDQTRLTDTLHPGFSWMPSFSPDGSRIAYTSTADDPGNEDVYVMDADGTNRTRLTTSEAVDARPVFSPDGSKIAFTSTRDGHSEIYVMDADGTDQVRLTNISGGYAAEPDFSPDGSKLVFYAQIGEPHELYTVDVDGTDMAPLTDSPDVPETDPGFSPDGTKVVFEVRCCEEFWPVGLFVMDAAGGGATQLVDNTSPPGLNSQPDWGVSTVHEGDLHVIDCDDPRLASVTEITGNLVIDAQCDVALALPNLVSVGGDVGILVSLSGEATIFDVGLASLEVVAGNLTVAARHIAISGEPIVFTPQLGSLEAVGGDLTVVELDGSDPIVLVPVLGDLQSVGCDLTIETAGPTLDLGTLQTVGCDVSLTSHGEVVTARTAAGNSDVKFLGGTAELDLGLQAGAFGEQVPFTIAREPDRAAEAGMGAGGAPAQIDPLAGYRFAFAIPTLGSRARLHLTIDLARLDAATREAVLAGVTDGSASIAVKGDDPAAAYQALRRCAAGEVPALHDCVAVVLLDASGQPIGPGTAPAYARFEGEAGHFSTYVVALVDSGGPTGGAPEPDDAGTAAPPLAGTTLQPPAFGPDTLVALEVLRKRIAPRRPVAVAVLNSNAFPVAGRLSARARVRTSRTRVRRLRIAPKDFAVPAGAATKVAMRLPKAARRSLRRGRKVAIRFTAEVRDPAGIRRKVAERVTVRRRQAA